MSACVHHAIVDRGELEARRFPNRQRIDVSANRNDGRSAPTTTNPRDQPGAGNALNALDAECAQRDLEPLGRPCFLEGKLRLAMDGTSQLDERPAHVVRKLFDD